MAWSFDDGNRTMQALYYPTLVGSKEKLFEEGYIAKRSGHTRGSTVDLTIIKLGEKVKSPLTVTTRALADGTVIPYLDDGTVDMGSSFDLFHPASHQDSPYIKNPVYQANREILRRAMKKQGFNEYENEWWHFTLANEPFPSTYFDFLVECQSAEVSAS